MGGLNATLSIASQALMAQQAELTVTSNNIANANTPGYARQIVNLQEAAPTGDGTTPGGVDITGIQSVQDELLNTQVLNQTSAQGSANAQVNTLNELQTLFPTSGSNLSSSLSTFFSGLSALSSNPSNLADRSTVIANAQSLVQQFNSIASGITAPIASLNTNVQTDVTQINQLTAQAAKLNQQIAQEPTETQDSGTLSGQLTSVETQLAALTNIQVTHTDQGDTITTGNGTPLVLGGQSYNLKTSTNASGNTSVLDSNGNDITSTISGGDLGGVITVRDTNIPALQNSLDTLANQFATAFNNAQAQGYDATGNKGAALFSVPSTVAGSAAAIKLTTTDPNAIAASSDGTSGSNGNIANLTAVQTSTLPAGSSATTLSSNLIYQVGSLASSASAEYSATTTSLTSLSNQQNSVSGVSIDQESANLIRYQQAYEAAAKVVSTISNLFSTIIGMMPAA